MSKATLAVIGFTILFICLLAFRGIAMRSDTGEMPEAAISADTNPAPQAEAIRDLGPTDFEEASVAAREAKAAYRARKYEEALGYFEELTWISPDNATAFLYAGLCKVRLGDKDGARESLSQAIELQPTNEAAIQTLIPLLVESGSWKEAETLQAQLIEQNRYDVEPVIGMARLHRQKGDLKRAIETCERALELDSSNQDALLELGVALNQAQRSEEAVETFQRLVSMDSSNAFAQAGMGVSLLLTNRYSEAVEPLEEGVRLAPEEAELHLNLAMAYENLGRIEDSLNEYEAFVRLTRDQQKAERVGNLVKQARAALAERGSRP